MAHPSLAVTHADLDYSAVKLDTGLAKRMFDLAKKDLAEGKTAEADAAMLAIQVQGVIFEYDEVELPLEEAADNLKLAEIEMKEGRHQEAKAALNVAVDELKKYEKKAGEGRAADVKALHDEITKLTSELDKGKPSETDQKKHASTISGWWHRATSWLRGTSP